MKFIYRICPALLVLLMLQGCGAEAERDKAAPVTKPRSELQSEVRMDKPVPNLQYSKLYRKGNELYAIVKHEGVQVIDNSEPQSPTSIAFVHLPGVDDVVVDGDHFLANQYADLVIFSRTQQKEVGRVKDLYKFQDYIDLPSSTDWVHTDEVPEDHVVVGYTIGEKGDASCFIFCS